MLLYLNFQNTVSNIATGGNMIKVRWLGRGGQGGFTASRLLGKAASLFEGKYAMAFPSFGPERRGAPVLAFTRIDDKKITDRSEFDSADYLVIMDESLLDESAMTSLSSEGKVILNSAAPQRYSSLAGSRRIIALDATTVALEIINRPITNTAMFGALVAASNIVTLNSALSSIEAEMKPAIAAKNKDIVKKAYDLVKEMIDG